MFIVPHSYLIHYEDENGLQAAIDLFISQLEAHKQTVDIPTPTATPLVEEIVRKHNGEFTIEVEESEI